MCGFPHHASAGYISRLLSAGERVAVCDQIEDPREAKGIVRREVTRVLTPGLTEESGTLKVDENHFVAALAMKGNQIGIASFDLSTGYFQENIFQCRLFLTQVQRHNTVFHQFCRHYRLDHGRASLKPGGVWADCKLWLDYCIGYQHGYQPQRHPERAFPQHYLSLPGGLA